MKALKSASVINGWVVIDKAKNKTSANVTAQTKKILGAKKAGHAGTLDPLGTGVLPIALGEATKTISYVVDKFKHYRFTIRWGEERDSDDAEGAVINVSNERPREKEIRSTLCKFTGEIDQVPPRYSAIKINGERAYKLARAGRVFNLPRRKVFVKEFTLLALLDADLAEFEVVCGKGTYIRSLSRDLGRKLGVFSHLTELRRIKCGPFFEKNATPEGYLPNLLNIFCFFPATCRKAIFSDPDVYTGETKPNLLLFKKFSINKISQFLGNSVSLFAIKIYSPFAMDKPALKPFAKPLFESKIIELSETCFTHF